MVWDGECGFCKYWTIRWAKITKDRVEYIPYQDAHSQFPDIDIQHFKQASRLIDKDGRIFSGPQSAYKTLSHGSVWGFLNKFYESYAWFRLFSDRLYNLIAHNRPAFFRISKFLFGSNPEEPRPFWIIYLVIIMYFMYV